MKSAEPFGARVRPGFLLLVVTGLLVLASVRLDLSPDGLALVVERVPLNPSDLDQTRIGPLRFRGGLWLRSDDPRFGGLSGLRVSEDGSQLLAVSDCGYGFSASLGYDGRGHLVDLHAARLLPLTGLDGGPLVRQEKDAESLTFDAGSSLLVGFEGRPRLWRYARSPPFGGPAEPVPQPSIEEECRSNKGPETLVALGDGRLLMACEAGGADDSAAMAWVGRGETWRPRTYPLTLEGLTGAFSPTAAARLPQGDVVVLERRFPPLGARLMRLSRKDLEGDGPLSPEEFARIEPPLTLDNFEGLDIRRDSVGRTLLYLVSDDNGCTKRLGVNAPRLQRSLVLLFELAE